MLNIVIIDLLISMIGKIVLILPGILNMGYILSGAIGIDP